MLVPRSFLIPSLLAMAVLVAGCSASPSAHPSSSSASGLSLGETSTFSVPGVSVPGTPTRYDKVMVRRFGSPSATNVLVLVPGTLAGAADFDIVGPYLAAHVPNLQVWAEMRREGALEDNAMLLRVLNGTATVQQAFDYYVGWIAESQDHTPLPAAQGVAITTSWTSGGWRWPWATSTTSSSSPATVGNAR